MTEFDLNKQVDVERRVDELLRDRPDALKLRRDNREFISKLEEQQITKEKATVQVFGVKSVNVNAILKDNIWNRSIFTTDKLCRLFLGCTLEQLIKYRSKKRLMSLNIFWILIIAMGIGIAVIVMLILLPSLGIM